MEGCDVVIHAAALKRIEVGQYNPEEMVKTNEVGTMNVVNAALDARVDRVVFTSTDKAWHPVSPYGYSKAQGERIVLSGNLYVSRTRFVVTRYGNVMGSTGSVIPVWRAAQARGERCRMHDPEATRFWMSVDEAVALVQAAVDGDKTLHIPWLPAFRLGDLAQAMGIDYDIVGMPEWEKKHEGLSDMNTSDRAPRMTMEEIKQRLQEIP
jgi:UDP-N-acetylglucosamine 4,6-dehydratase